MTNEQKRSAVFGFKHTRNAWRWVLFAAVLIGSLNPANAQAGDIIFQNGFELTAPISPDPAYGGSDSHLVVGSDGRVHMVYLADDDDTNSSDPIRYGECAGDCTDATNWQFITLGFDGTPGVSGGPRIALTTADQPRVFWYEESSVDAFRYAACDAGCGSLAHWSISTIALPPGAIQAFKPSNEPFALDSQNHPHFFTSTFNGLYYASCTSYCASGGTWSFFHFGGTTSISGAIDLHFYGQTPLFVDDYPDAINGNGSVIGYGGYNGTQWVHVGLYQASTNSLASIPISYAMNSSGSPRVAFYQLDHEYTNHQVVAVNKLVYGKCDPGTTGVCDANGFSWVYAGVPQKAGFAGFDLKLDAGGIPHIAYSSRPDATGMYSQHMGLVTCSNCMGSGGLWYNSIVEARETSTLPVPPAQPPCTADDKWYIGAEPSLALHGGRSYVSYDIGVIGACPLGNGQYSSFYVNGPIRYAER